MLSSIKTSLKKLVSDSSRPVKAVTSLFFLFWTLICVSKALSLVQREGSCKHLSCNCYEENVYRTCPPVSGKRTRNYLQTSQEVLGLWSKGNPQPTLKFWVGEQISTSTWFEWPASPRSLGSLGIAEHVSCVLLVPESRRKEKVTPRKTDCLPPST